MAQGRGQETFIHMLIKDSYFYPHNFCKELVTKYQDQIIINSIYSEGNTLLHYAADRNASDEMIQALLDLGANPNALNNDNKTPLHLATNRKNIINKLIKAGALITDKDKDGNTPLHAACSWISSFDERDSTIDQVANPLITKDTVNTLNMKGESPLHILANSNSFSTYMLFEKAKLIHEGANTKAKDMNGKTPIDIINQRLLQNRPVHNIDKLNLNNKEIESINKLLISKDDTQQVIQPMAEPQIPAYQAPDHHIAAPIGAASETIAKKPLYHIKMKSLETPGNIVEALKDKSGNIRLNEGSSSSTETPIYAIKTPEGKLIELTKDCVVTSRVVNGKLIHTLTRPAEQAEPKPPIEQAESKPPLKRTSDSAELSPSAQPIKQEKHDNDDHDNVAFLHEANNYEEIPTAIYVTGNMFNINAGATAIERANAQEYIARHTTTNQNTQEDITRNTTINPNTQESNNAIANLNFNEVLAPIDVVDQNTGNHTISTTHIMGAIYFS